MKFLLVILSLVISYRAFATPVMDTAIGAGSNLVVTIVPDDKDPNLYYFFPNHFGLSRDSNNKRQLFSYIEKSEGFLGLSKSGYVNTIFEAGVSSLLSQKTDEIKKANPNAKFAPITIFRAGFLPHDVFNILLTNIDCQHYGNVIGQQVACAWKVKGGDCEIFRHAVTKNALVQVLDYGYSFIGMIQGKPVEINHSVPVYVSDLESGNYFFDSEGRVISD